ncbi:uncharacterized protein LOC121054795 [Oryza brachyantha]|uniref:uncharacterized protein LOC121054795 n=1 Tax=Oryza brachyantha TaxID=4533 RepID=UPI001ADACC17|nr:uncharacterized protein LOC121054795 [Oryza brachyantha]
MGVVEGMIIAAAAAGDVETASGFSSGSGSPASSSLTDEGGEVTSSSSMTATAPWSGGGGGCDCSFSSSESEEEAMELDGDRHGGGGRRRGPLYELAAPLLAQLPIRTGLSSYYQGKSQSFTSLCDARCVEDLAKKTTPYITRMKLQHRCHGVVADRSSNSRHAPGHCIKTIAKKTPRCSSDRLQSRARGTSLFTSAADHLHTRARKSCQDAS